MAKELIVSTAFPSYHRSAGYTTCFVEHVLNSLGCDEGTILDQFPDIAQFINPFFIFNNGERKNHTIRAGFCWKAGDKFRFKVWSAKPYHSKKIIFSEELEIKKVWNIHIDKKGSIWIGNKLYAKATDYEAINRLAQNDGLSLLDFLSWFRYPAPFDGQIICWKEDINY